MFSLPQVNMKDLSSRRLKWNCPTAQFSVEPYWLLNPESCYLFIAILCRVTPIFLNITTLKQKLLSASSKALKVCIKNLEPMTSFDNIHIMCNRATPNKMLNYKLALNLFKLYNCNCNSHEFVNLNFSQVLTSIQTTFQILKSNRTRIGLNSLANCLHHINDKIPLEWLNLSIGMYKVKCKKLLFWYRVK